SRKRRRWTRTSRRPPRPRRPPANRNQGRPVMSDTTTLSLQYAASAAFAEQMSRRVLALKKDEEPAAGGDDRREARTFLAGVLRGLVERLRPDGHTPDEAMAVPEEVFARLEARNRSDAG